MKYDLKAMKYNPNMLNVYDKFLWELTPQGYDFWDAEDSKEINGEPLSGEAVAALKEMQKQYDLECDKGNYDD